MAEHERELTALAAAEAGGALEGTARRLRATMDVLAAFAPARRGVCPTRGDLVACFDGTLTAEDTARLMSHVRACPFCTSDLADLEALAKPALIEAAVGLARTGLRLLSHSFASSAQPAPAAARGAEPVPTLELTTNLDDLDVHLRLHAGGPTGADVRVLLERDHSPLARTRVSLYRAEALLESRLTGDSGEVVFAAVGAGDYSVAIAPRPGAEMARLSLALAAE